MGKLIWEKDGYMVEANHAKFKVGKTSWVISKFLTEDSKEEEFFRVYKNGEMFSLDNGNDFETANEAVVNILMHYQII